MRARLRANGSAGRFGVRRCGDRCRSVARGRQGSLSVCATWCARPGRPSVSATYCVRPNDKRARQIPGDLSCFPLCHSILPLVSDTIAHMLLLFEPVLCVSVLRSISLLCCCTIQTYAFAFVGLVSMPSLLQDSFPYGPLLYDPPLFCPPQSSAPPHALPPGSPISFSISSRHNKPSDSSLRAGTI